MLARLLAALRDYFADTDDPTPGDAIIVPADPTMPRSRNNERLLRLFARFLVELAGALKGLNQQAQQQTASLTDLQAQVQQNTDAVTTLHAQVAQNTEDIATIETRLDG